MIDTFYYEFENIKYKLEVYRNFDTKVYITKYFSWGSALSSIWSSEGSTFSVSSRRGKIENNEILPQKDFKIPKEVLNYFNKILNNKIFF